MDKTKDPGITFERVDLFDCQISKVNPGNEFSYHLELTRKERGFSKDNKHLFLLLAFDLMAGVEKPPFEFKCSFLAHYSRKEDAPMTWDEFQDSMALAHVIPFLREFISNITNRLPVPVLMLSPINVFLLLADYEKRNASTSPQNQTKPQS